MSWRKYFTSVDNSGLPLNVTGSKDTSGPGAATSRYASWLPEVYAGSPNRLMRYMQYDQMDNDLEVNAALDTIAEFGSQAEATSKFPFELSYKGKPSDTENKILTKSLEQWCRLNEMHKRAFRIFRSTIKYGDQFFLRDPETFKLYWVNPEDVSSAIVNESAGKEIDQYIVKNIALNLQDMVAVDTRKLKNTTENGT